MTIFASHFAIVPGAWRLRVRIDLDEPREADLRDADARASEAAAERGAALPQIAARGRG